MNPLIFMLPGGFIYYLLTRSVDKSAKLSPNFTLADLTKSHTATQMGIVNVPGSAELYNLKRVANELLEPIKKAYGWVQVTSGYRNPELNTAVGGASSSRHMHGDAVDVKIPGYFKALPKSVKIYMMRTLAQHMQFGKAIAYGNSGHIHLALGTGHKLYWTEKKGGSAIRVS